MEDLHSYLNPKDYWDRTAKDKTFTHPLNLNKIESYINQRSTIVDYGCGYGRLVKELTENGYSNVRGFDISAELINRGIKNGVQNIATINSPLELSIENESVDCFMLFAVLTCIPKNKDQEDLIQLLHSKLKSGGIIYISDYYIQQHSTELDRYETLNEDKFNHGVFKLKDGITFRHHTKEWITQLFKAFHLIKEWEIEVKTMNGNDASAFQMILKK